MPSILSIVEDFEFFPLCKVDLHCRLAQQSGFGLPNTLGMKMQPKPAELIGFLVGMSSWMAGKSLLLKSPII